MRNKISKNNIPNELHQLSQKTNDLAKKVKDKYRRADTKTKRRIIAKTISATTIISGILSDEKVKSKGEKESK